MTSTTTTTALDGDDLASVKQEHPVAVLRRSEGHGLITLACDAVHATSQLTHYLHEVLYGPQGAVPVTDLKAALRNARACLQVADQYLGDLDGVLDTAVPPDWEQPVPEPATHW
jgi:hypothetical protein